MSYSWIIIFWILQCGYSCFQVENSWSIGIAFRSECSLFLVVVRELLMFKAHPARRWPHDLHFRNKFMFGIYVHVYCQYN
ncbi:hypothetical protein MANES_06G009850v8 [Manihot esculenta]|uniref:Uncharacterized protein n=1 Tax=Manihot esculenta TaxID=3983 RepID=A0ACB7HLD2_MANES|nr:hypothetical protein MANES_06G009850v8 [Manihot esculenta]